MAAQNSINNKLGVATAVTINRITLTAPTSGATLTIADGKTATISNSITLVGTDGRAVTFPTTDATMARTDAGQIFTGANTFSSDLIIQTLTAGRAGGGFQTTTAFGVAALGTNTTGVFNTAFGYHTLNANTTGGSNCAFGLNSVVTNTAGSFNCGFGVNALNLTTGSGNSGYGFDALVNNSSGDDNTGAGYEALRSNTTGLRCVAIGYRSGYASSANANTTGNDNVYVGANTVGNGTGRTHELVVGANAVGLGSNTTAIGTNGTTTACTIYGTQTIPSGIAADGGGHKHSRVTTGSVAGLGSALVTVTWTTAFADTSYTVVASVLNSTAATAALKVTHVESITASAITVRVENTSVVALTGTLHVIAIHD